VAAEEGERAEPASLTLEDALEIFAAMVGESATEALDQLRSREALEGAPSLGPLGRTEMNVASKNGERRLYAGGVPDKVSLPYATIRLAGWSTGPSVWPDR
jgi:hypothetical protein